MSSQTSGKICNPLKKIVSQNRRRYICENFNLDLTYITDRIIAMGYPAEHSEKFYRNSMEDTKNFLEQYHSKHYLVFNLRGQFTYDEKNFDNRVRVFEMTDHHPPKLELIAPFCREVHRYLQEDPKNVVAVHCKAGKGRTGVMICAYLVYINFFLSPRKIMEYYSIIRTMNNKGITIPSQRRYVYYFHHLRQKNLNYIPLRIELVGIYIERPPRSDSKFTKGLLKIRVAERDIEIFCGKGLLFNSKMAEEEEDIWKKYSLGIGEDHYNPNNPEEGKNVISRRCYGWNISKSGKRVFLEGDIRVDLFCEPQVKLIGYKKNDIKIGHIWFSTMFTCPGYCGGNYIHGDEVYTYPNNKSDLVKEIIKPINKSCNDKNNDFQSCDDSLLLNYNNHVEIEKHNKSNSFTKESCKSSSKIAISIDKVKKKFTKNSEQLNKSLPETDSIKEGEIFNCNSPKYDNNTKFIKELVVEKPPGLDDHCSELSLNLIYPDGRKPPRYCINEMLKKAYEKNLIVDTYNERRFSFTSNGKLIPKSPEGEPDGNGPYTLVRKEDEHVQIYNSIEIDRAYKNKLVDDGFKLIIVTRCIDTENKEEVAMAKKFVDETYKKQKERDARKSKYNKKSQYNENDSNNEDERKKDVFNKSDFHDQHFKDDPRLEDVQQRRYFFRQRIDSTSQHPEIHYHCPFKKYSSKECINNMCRKNNKLKDNCTNNTKEQTNTNIEHENISSLEENTIHETAKLFYSNNDEVTKECINNDNQDIQNCEKTSPDCLPISENCDSRKINNFSSKNIIDNTINQEKEIVSNNSVSSIKSLLDDKCVIEEGDNSESSWGTSSSCSSTTSVVNSSF
ncbi:Phosphatidylinositol 3,4,5-trisphosphate 3-phosphatase and dual-specificity protein phosphatase PTEN [Strongyloides ratti]|uniref:phosphatidylinositol-3,4,5-trisphosphate 3-phosphatase n=1 Tax=Strongyloides ratti TaxID=34506 RepID=A0A090MWN0_STRRB|nr:Phosphatidylinositol 3,4,5-trisphosphate 3-phosphatase and dual-specificity protein phosphatase PTEN [Strongyloides ratti]CEF63969.1 Phosphatidylinositol 3,4,5-trisphosphate 3-phosphatase and dual-specificity protein phosphatase PTEN [Strongyloides ratti]